MKVAFHMSNHNRKLRTGLDLVHQVEGYGLFLRLKTIAQLFCGFFCYF